jgi:hypothetical protein
MTIDWYWQKTQKTDPACRQRGQTIAGLRWRGPAVTVNYRPVLSSERALQNNKLQLFKRKSQGEKNWSLDPDGHLTPRRTDRLIVSCNVSLTYGPKPEKALYTILHSSFINASDYAVQKRLFTDWLCRINSSHAIPSMLKNSVPTIQCYQHTLLHPLIYKLKSMAT